MSFKHKDFCLTQDDVSILAHELGDVILQNSSRIEELLTVFFSEHTAKHICWDVLKLDDDPAYSRWDDWVDDWLSAEQYAGQGLAPERNNREDSILKIIQKADAALRYGHIIMGEDYQYIWQGVKARAAIDFQNSTLTIEDLALLSGLSLQVIRNSVSTGALVLNDDKSINPDIALAWLEKRREFIPSRWRDPNDNQSLLGDPDMETVLLPRTKSNVFFLPENVMRLSKDKNRISITIGKKGEEQKFDNFYKALEHLTYLYKIENKVWWRSINSSGNWSIVTSHGALIPFPRETLFSLVNARMKEIFS